MIKAIIFDLDDTLYSEIDYLKSGFYQVSLYLSDKYNISNCYDKLLTLYNEGEKQVFNALLEKENLFLSKDEIIKIIDIYRNHFPSCLKLDPTIKDTLLTLKKRGYLLGIITDGRPNGQWNKIKALKLDDIMDKIIVTDEIGGISYRKPNPKAFEMMKEFLSVDYNQMVYVGDNREKDFVIGAIYPITTIEVLSLNKIHDKLSYSKGILPKFKIGHVSELLNLLAKE